jgi:fucose permease
MRWRVALGIYFVMMGAIGTVWAARLPQIKLDIHANNLDLGLMGFGGSFGAMSGVWASHRIIGRFGTRVAMTFGFSVVPLAYTFESLAAQFRWHDAMWIVGALYFVSGVGFSCTDIAVNVDGAAVERAMGRPILSGLHGFFSIGAVLGSLVGTIGAAFHTSIAVQVIGVSALVAIVPVGTHRLLPGIKESASGPKTKLQRHDWFTPALITISIAIFFFTLNEGSASAWLSLLVNESKHLSVVIAGVALTVFGVAMTVLRLAGNAWTSRWSSLRILRTLAVVGIVGALILIFGSGAPLILLGATLWGCGVALGFPLSISLAGRTPVHPERRVVYVATYGYIAFLTGPPLLGFISQRFGLRSVPITVLICFILVAIALFFGPNPDGDESAITVAASKD